MAVTNQMLMLMYRAENNIDEDTQLYTYKAWKLHGRQVKRGEKARHTVMLWEHSKRKKDENGEIKYGSFCYMKKMYLFELDQTEEIIKKVAQK